MLGTFFNRNPSPVHQLQPFLSTTFSPAFAFANVDAYATTTTQANNQTFNDISFMQHFSANMIAAQKSQTFIVESRTDKCRKREDKFNNNMLQLLLVGGIIDFSSPGTFTKPCMTNYT
jgi:hypothetical protein